MKRIIICCDGTWNKPGEKDNGVVTQTNVQKIFNLIGDSDSGGIEQRYFYINGVGSTGNFLEQLEGGIAGTGLDANIISAYSTVVDEYEQGDENYFFGFSRGAYTARSLAGFIVNCGILKKENRNMIPQAYNLYRDRTSQTHPSSDAMLEFKAQYSYEPAVKFIGVWDTVGALGIPLAPFVKLNAARYAFHDETLSSIVEYAYHAMAIDEHREIFDVTLWKQMPAANQQLEQVWFTGCHSNVGGGYEDYKVSDHALQWMITKAKGSGLAILTPAEGYIDDDPIGGEIIEANNFAWKLLNGLTGVNPAKLRDFYRIIDDPDYPGQSVDASAYDRRTQRNDYDPQNLH